MFVFIFLYNIDGLVWYIASSMYALNVFYYDVDLLQSIFYVIT